MAQIKAVPAKTRAAQKPLAPGEINVEGKLNAEGAPIRGWRKRSNGRRPPKP